MSDVDSARRDPPADWRERLVAVLSADGITELPKASKTKRFLIGYGKVIGWVLVAALVWLLIAFGGSVIASIPFYVFLPHEDFDKYINGLAPVFALIGIGTVAWFVYPRVRRAARELMQVRLGHRPTEVLRRAKRAPVLFLRSFNFDSITSSVPGWQERLPITGVTTPTSELNLVQMTGYARLTGVIGPACFPLRSDGKRGGSNRQDGRAGLAEAVGEPFKPGPPRLTPLHGLLKARAPGGRPARWPLAARRCALSN